MTDASVTEEFDSKALFSSSLNVDAPASASLSQTNDDEQHNQSFNESMEHVHVDQRRTSTDSLGHPSSDQQDNGPQTSASPSHLDSNESSYAEVLKQVHTDDFHQEFFPRNEHNGDDSETIAFDPSKTFNNNEGEGEDEPSKFNVEDPSDTFLEQDDAKLLLIDEDSSNSRTNFELDVNLHEKPDELK